MKKSVLVLLGLTFLSTTFAETSTLEKPENRSYFQHILELSKSSKRPQIEEIKDVLWVGKCFRKVEPNRPISGAYILRQKNLSKLGPISKGHVVYEALTTMHFLGSPDYYEHISASEHALMFLDEYEGYKQVKVAGDSLKVNIDAQTTSDLYQGEEFLLEVIQANGKPVDSCYYFKAIE